MKVKVYRNLHKQCYSVVNRATGRVIARERVYVIVNATFRVGAAGRARVLRERRKNVHAYVFGEIGNAQNLPTGSMRQARYNPYEAGFFRDKRTGKRLEKASVVLLSPAGIFYLE